MTRTDPHPARRRAATAIALLVAANAVGGAVYGLAGAPSVPSEWLEGTTFDSYVVPSLVLGAVIGGSQLVAGVLLARRNRGAGTALVLAAAILAAWIAAQVLVIGYVSPLQPVMLVVAAIEAELARGLVGGGRSSPVA